MTCVSRGTSDAGDTATEDVFLRSLGVGNELEGGEDLVYLVFGIGCLRVGDYLDDLLCCVVLDKGYLVIFDKKALIVRDGGRGD